MSKAGDGFEAKVANLVAVTQRLDVPRILQVRRLTLADPQSLKWASARQLDLIFNVILGKALERTDRAEIVAASTQHFDPMLPPGPEEQVDKERWLLFDLAKPMLSGASASTTETTEAVMDQIEADGDDNGNADGEDEGPQSYGDFASMFDDSISRYVKRTLAVIAAGDNRPHIPLPFYLAAPFASSYLHVLRDTVLPAMRSSRRLKELALSRNWTEAGAGGRIIGMIQAGGSDNGILHHWDARWQVFHPEHVIKGKDGKPKPRKPQDDPWQFFQDDAAKHGYLPPYPSDIPMLQRIIRLDGEVLADAWGQLAQMYEQEFQPKTRAEQGRAGSFRDGVLKFIDKLEFHGGDILTIKAFFDFPKVDRLFLKQLIQILGRSDMERMKRAPLIIGFYNDLPK